jgi:alkyldihydroxyacetonephosphate synthase
VAVTLASFAVHALPPPRQVVLDAAAALSAVVQGRVSTKELDRLAYARDSWSLTTLWARQGRVPLPPDAIVWPGTDDDVSKVIRLARERRLAVIPFGAGSGLCGGTVASAGGIVLDLKRFDFVGPVDPQRRCVEVGAGVLGETLERRLEARGWTLGHAPSSIAMSTVGGWLATRSAGHLSGRYGKIEDMVLSVSGVFGTGERFQTPERPFRGPDFAQLIMGSEGTLCAFTSARLRVHPRPEARVFRAFDFSSVERGLEAMRRVFREGLRPAVAQLADPFATAFDALQPGSKVSFLRGLLNSVPARALAWPRLLRSVGRLATKCRLAVMFEGEAKHAEAEDRAAAACCLSMGAADLGENQGRLWYRHRNDSNFRQARVTEAGASFDRMDVAAPWHRVLDVYQRVLATAGTFVLVLCHFSHASADGCALEFTFIGEGGSRSTTDTRSEQLWRAALGAATSAGANVSHHHGIGLQKSRAYQESLGEGRHALSTLKRLLDPDGIMNPGKLGL